MNFGDRINKLPGLIISYRWDIFILTILVLCAAVGSFAGMGLFTETVIEEDLYDVWFRSDIPRVYANMLSRNSDHHRTKVHPLFSILTFPPVYLFRHVFGVDGFLAVRLFSGLVAALWVGALYSLLRLISRRILDSLVFSVMAMVSASALFWFVVPETYALGSLGILLALNLVVLAEKRKVADFYYVLASAFTLSVTVTNWMVGIFATIVKHPWKRALQISANAFVVVVVFWGIQKFIFPSAIFFIGDTEELKYISSLDLSHMFHTLKSFFFHTAVMPAYALTENSRLPDWPKMITQKSMLISGNCWGNTAVILWAALLVLGFWALFRLKTHKELRLVIGLSLAGQIILHLVYGSEVFLYSLHFLPLLVILAFLPTLTKFRLAALFLAGGMIVFLGLNNWFRFNKAVDYFQHHGSQSHMQKIQKELKPGDSLPRAEGHVIFARPGSQEAGKGSGCRILNDYLGLDDNRLNIVNPDGVLCVSKLKVDINDKPANFILDSAFPPDT